MSDLLPASDGLYLGNDTRRWNLLLKRILSGEEPVEGFIDGRLWWHGDVKRLFVEDSDGQTYYQVPVDGDPQPPQTHGNDAHNPQFLSYYYVKGANYNANDIAVGASSPVTLGYYSGSSGKYHQPFASFNYRPGVDLTANRTLEVWWEVPLGTQKSAKFPVSVALNESKRPFFFFVPFRDVFDQLFWRTKFSTAQSIYLRAQTDSESVIVSDLYVSGVEIG